MPTGVIIDALAVLFGGLIGGGIGKFIPDDFKVKMNMIFGISSIVMGTYSVAPMKNMAEVIFAVILGTLFGIIIHLGHFVDKGAMAMQRVISKILPASPTNLEENDFKAQLVTLTILFCASGTGIFGSILNGFTGDSSILVAKAILDFFTAMFFAIELGYVAGFIAVPQFIFFIILFFAGNWIYPLTTPTMILDFKAAGGLLMLATGFRMLKIKMFPIADMLPALILVCPLSWLWTNVINVILK
ncbi:DUF554 domain-containing protein [Lactococcus lactis subsp. lactis]|uniref:DUF554 domain-containing protein n=1 Tax=Lactococcus lactis TaxID=1358 RepID=UPI00223B6C65|nr:DUF554 domain-containing protein [Lactococcus lactis]MCT0017213.1 DUF554 domain-containing protein [Lactococcus lactis subsp. lactis]